MRTRPYAVRQLTGLMLVTALALTTQAGDLGSWTYRAKITFSGYTRSEPLANFPALLVLSTNIPGFSYAQLASPVTAADLRFATDRLNEIPYSIEHWNTNGSSFVWVRVPSLAGSDSAIWMYWGKSGATVPAYTADGSTWANGFAGVWHMNATNAPDASPNQNHGQSFGNTNAVGKLHGAQGFGLAGTTPRYLSCPSSASFDAITKAMTLSAWVRFTENGWYHMIVTKNGDAIALRSNADNRRPEAKLAVWQTSGASYALPLNTWNHVAATFDDVGDVQRLIVNGVVALQTTTTASLGSHAGQPLRIGWRDNAHYMRGLIDQVEVSSVARSTNWVWAAYRNQLDHEAFNTYGPVEFSGMPEVVNLDAQVGSATSATLRGEILDPGLSPATVKVFWGETDPGMTPVGWQNTNAFSGTFEAGVVTTNVTVAADRIYYYRFWATNDTGETWSDPAALFITGPVTLEVTRPDAYEQGMQPAWCEIQRPDWSIAVPLRVSVGAGPSSTATLGDDFYFLSAGGSVTIPVGSLGTSIEVVPYHDNLVEGAETVDVSLQPGPHVIGTPGNGTVTIHDASSSAWYVAPEGSNANDGLSHTSAFATVSYAVTQASDGHAIYLLPGLYPITSQITVNKGVIIKGLAGAEQTRIRRASGTTRIFQLSHAGAILDDLSIENGLINSHGGGVYMSGGGVVQNCIIAENQSYGHGGSANGAGVALYGNALVTNCVIRHNILNLTEHDTGQGGGAYLAAAGCALVDSLVVSNRTGSSYRPRGTIYMANGRVERCTILFNRVTGTTQEASGHDGGGAGIWMSNGTVRDCLIAGNSLEARGAFRHGGGIKMSGGTVENCTVIHNRTVTDFGGIHRTGGTVKNSIVYHNLATGTGATAQNIAPHANVSYSCAPELVSGTANQIGDPGFVRAGSGAGLTADIGDAHLAFESLLVDAGATSGSLRDLELNPRPLDGIGDGTALYDLGCYELTLEGGEFRCGFRSPTPGGMAPLNATFYAVVAGGNTNVVNYVWDVDGDGIADYAGPGLQTVNHTYADQGSYTVTLTVTNTANQSATATRVQYVVVAGFTYVSPEGAHIPPFGTWADAATNIQAAVDQAAVGTVVLVSNGVYRVNAPILLNKYLTVRSVNGATVTVVDGQGITRCCNIAHPDAVLDGFTVRNGFADDGAGLYLTGGTAQNCIIRNNRDNAVGAGNGAGVWMSGDTLRNCVVVGNQLGSRSRGRGAGIYLVGGTVENCTVSRNIAGISEGGIYKTGGTVVNTIIHDNLAPAAANLNTTAGITYSCAPELTSGTGNLTADPRLTDLGGGYGADHLGGLFRPGLDSPCIDSGSDLAQVTEDLDRAPRPADGNGDTIAQHDIGAYEIGTAANTGAFRCTFHTPTPTGEAPLNATFTAAVAGSNTTVVSYAWDFTADGSDDLTGAGYQTASFNYTESGRWYNVKLTCVNELGQIATCVRTEYIQLASEDVYVSQTGASTPPYDTWETAARYIEDGILAVSSAGNGTVWVGAGTYALTAPIVIDKAAAVRGAHGVSQTILDGQNIARCLQITHAQAKLNGFTIRKGRIAGSLLLGGAGIYMTGGTVSDSLVEQCEVDDTSLGDGAGVYMTGGRLEACTVRNNRAFGSNGSTAQGAGIFMSGSSVVSNCVVSGNTMNQMHGSWGAGVYMAGTSQLLGSTIVSNRTDGYHRPSGGGVYMSGSGALVSHCVIRYNSTSSGAGSEQPNEGGGGVNMQGGTLRNSLVEANAHNMVYANRFGGGVRMDGGRMENCTVVRNLNANNAGGVYVGASASVTNTIVYANQSGDGLNVNVGAAIGYSCAPELVSGAGNMTADPVFRNPGSGFGTTATPGDYRMRHESPAANQGLQLPWMTAGSVDLAGDARIQMGQVDIGAYEAPAPAGTMVILR